MAKKEKTTTAVSKPKRRRSDVARKAKAVYHRIKHSVKKADWKNTLIQAAIVTGVAVAAATLSTKLPASVSPRIVGVGSLALGVLGDGMLKNPMAKSACLGVAVFGGMSLAKSFMPSLKTVAGEEMMGEYPQLMGTENVYGQDVYGQDVYGTENVYGNEIYAGEEISGEPWKS